jgi:hypothetical protein
MIKEAGCHYTLQEVEEVLVHWFWDWGARGGSPAE